MNVRKIVKIDQELCDGCGLCVPSCAEGALQIVDGKAKLASDVYCDGLGACLGDCPNHAISVVEREAEAFDQEAVIRHLDKAKETEQKYNPPSSPCGCPGAAMKIFTPDSAGRHSGVASTCNRDIDKSFRQTPDQPSSLSHWPVQLRLVPVGAPFLQNADLLICADCVPFAVPDFHTRYLEGKSVLVGCPKLDDLESYKIKLKQIFTSCKPKSITVLRMEVPCCGGLSSAVIEALEAVGSDIPVEIHTIGIQEGIKREAKYPQVANIQGGS